MKNIIGTLRSDTIYGSDLNERIFGRSGKDEIHAGAGNDIIIGGMGQDAMWGGSGSDVFVFNRVTDNTLINPDLIFDFTRGEDKIDLTALDLDRKDIKFTKHFIYINTDEDAAYEMSLFLGMKLVHNDILI